MWMLLKKLLSKGKPEVFNTDQGSQFTSEAFTGLLEQHGVRVSMDGKGRYTDNLFIERLWRSLKYEEVYLKAYTGGRDARIGIGERMPNFASGYREAAPGSGTPSDSSRGIHI